MLQMLSHLVQLCVVRVDRRKENDVMILFMLVCLFFHHYIQNINVSLKKNDDVLAGIKKGDVFLEVDGMRMDDGTATPDDVASKLRGPEGSRVGVVMERKDKVEDFIITREPITITSVRSYMSEARELKKLEL